MSAHLHRSLPYMPDLDGLRAFAVLAVFAEHFTYSPLIRDWAPGMVGVRTFFVLSGFLITSILLKKREQAPLWQLARDFYLRRALRLTPAFAVAILVAAALGVAEMRQDWWVHGLYLSNAQIAMQERWSGAGHFWTLSVEEHFYLIWFPLVMMVPRRALPWVVLAGMIIALAWRMAVAQGASPFLDVLLPSQLDALGLGALIALARHDSRLAVVDRLFAHRWTCWGLLLAVPVVLAPIEMRPKIVAWPLAPLVVSLAAAAVIRRCLQPLTERRWGLRHPVLVHLGQISYGLYIWHYFVPPILYRYFPGIELLAEGPMKILRVFLWVAVSLLLAELSWRLIERPLLHLRPARATPQEPDPIVISSASVQLSDKAARLQS